MKSQNTYQYLVTPISPYHPFGMIMSERSFSSEKYRYGFNGKEKTDEINGDGNALDFGARIYDSRIGRWLSVDPLQKKYVDLTPYVGMGNNPIILIDKDGKEIIFSPTLKSTEYYTLLKNLATSNNAVVQTFYSKYLKEFNETKGKGKDLFLSFEFLTKPIYTGADAQRVEDDRFVDGGQKYSIRFQNWKSKPVNFDPTGKTQPSTVNGIAKKYVDNELGRLNNFIHEIVYHTSSTPENSTNHILSTQQFDDMFNVLKAYSSTYLNKNLTNEELVALVLQGANQKTLDGLKDHIQNKYGVNKTIVEYGKMSTELTQDKQDYDPQTGENGFEDQYLSNKQLEIQNKKGEPTTNLQDEIKKN